jgi:DnaJ family protein A protein 5
VDESESNQLVNDDVEDNIEYHSISSEEESESEEEPDSWRCECCRKDFKSAAQFENHTKSKKHKEKWKQYEKKLQTEAKQKAVEDLMDEIDGDN